MTDQKALMRAVLTLLLVLSAVAGHTAEISGRVVGISDGDSSRPQRNPREKTVGFLYVICSHKFGPTFATLRNLLMGKKNEECGTVIVVPPEEKKLGIASGKR